MSQHIEVLIIGGGPAGLSAALVLARCHRKVLVVDSGNYRNEKSHALNGFITRDGTSPRKFLEEARNDLGKYKVPISYDTVTSLARSGKGFTVKTKQGHTYESLKVLLATGLAERLPDIPGIDEFYGRKVFHCPYCDGWELQHGEIALMVSQGKAVIPVSEKMRVWSDKIHWLADYTTRPSGGIKKGAELKGVNVVSGRVSKLSESRNKLVLHFYDGSELKVAGLFFSIPCVQRSSLATLAGCAVTGKGAIRVDRHQETSIKGLYAAGDMVRDVQFVIIAAAEGAKAAVNINQALISQGI